MPTGDYPPRDPNWVYRGGCFGGNQMDKVGSIDKPYKCPKCDGETCISDTGHPHRPNLFGARQCPVCKGEGIVWPPSMRATSGYIQPITPTTTTPWVIGTGTPITTAGDISTGGSSSGSITAGSDSSNMIANWTASVTDTSSFTIYEEDD